MITTCLKCTKEIMIGGPEEREITDEDRECISCLRERTKPEEIGKVLKTPMYINICTCGATTTQQLYKRNLEEGKVEETYLAFCPCGNIFFSIPPQVYE